MKLHLIDKKLLLSIVALLGLSAFGTSCAFANTWYVRDGGGDSTQCTGTANAVYPGSGSGQACAFNNPRYAIGWDLNTPQVGAMSGGDTLYIDGDSDLSSGAQAQYMVGNDTTGGTTPTCGVYDKDCALANLPAGFSPEQPTSIIGTGTHKPQLWGHLFPWWVISANNNYITLQWLEITDHDACAYNEPNSANQCTDSPNYNNEYPDGIELGGSNIILTDVYVHGFGRYGINVPDGVSSMGNATFTRLWVIGNGSGGFTTGVNNALTGTWTFNQPIIEWNGCVEAYPVTGGVDNPANYSQCFGQQSGGYGDGLAFGPNGHLTAGNWTITGPGSISFNTQDGFDTLHGAGNGTMQIDKMRFEGNAGQQVKINALNAYITNNLIIGDCGWWYGSSHIASGTMPPGDTCRAGGDTVLFNVTNGSTSEIYNNTIVSNGNVAMESEDLGATGCNSSTKIYADNNIVLAGYEWLDDTSWNSSGGNAQTTYIYNDGSDGNGAGTCGAITWNEDYNIVLGTKNNNQGCSGAHDKCGTNPGFASTVPMGTSGGAANTYYQGTSAATLLSLSSSSPAVTAGVSGLTYWNGGNDYHNVTRTSPPSMGGLEANSCAANGYGCFYNSDCCAGGSCSDFICGGSTGEGSSASTSSGEGTTLISGGETTTTSATPPVVAITSPGDGSGFTAGSNITITATAFETNGNIANVSFYYNGTNLLGSSSASPYQFIAANVSAGNYTVTAVAMDTNGVSTTSGPVAITVSSATAPVTTPVTTPPATTPPVNTQSSLPVVAITSPNNGSSFAAGSNVTLTATASESGGNITNVSFYYNGTNLLGSSSASPYQFIATNVSAGNYAVTAVAMDANGVSTTSSPVAVTVTTATATAPVTTPATTPPVNTQSSLPVVAITSPNNGSSFAAGSNVTLTATASESGGNITNVSFYYNGTNLLGSSSASPYQFIATNVSAGNYAVTAVAMDANGVSTTSSPVAVTVTTATAPVTASLPVVAITSPGNGSSFATGSNVALTATASETGGSIAKVDYYYNQTFFLGTSTTSPYHIVARNVSTGDYTVTAIATDVNGVTAASSPIAVTIAPASSSSSSSGSTTTLSGSGDSSTSGSTATGSASTSSGSTTSSGDSGSDSFNSSHYRHHRSIVVP